MYLVHKSIGITLSHYIELTAKVQQLSSEIGQLSILFPSIFFKKSLTL
jgi:hypothetical protein